ncbi:MAG: maleylacetoacetate isomerase [Alphaproteobacteria bacterium]|nr:maleylacetoacetate isomerase [Alphaproteobacteria bacterium]MDA8003299.1 maleylacetoacetate isomerase [Alphaproteobacteria bacterium]MDA8005007.1 maleylacetoacetate isomerase [Alphaproteobacteria bacterium]MDA8012380.1 maleylacetoacetate isomerase [Alphaproteobacteria bacterium]
MSDIVLYEYWRSSASYRVRIALGLKGLVWRSAPVDLLSRDQRSEGFALKNPQGRVPVLEIDGLTLTQSLAMIEYLEETRPVPALLPGDSAGRARVRALAHLVAMEVQPVLNMNVLERVESFGGGDSREGWMRHFMPQGLGSFEALLSAGPRGRFCHGDVPTLADICLVPQVYNALRWDIDLGLYPRISGVVSACEGEPAFAAAHPDNHKPN